MAIKGTGVTAIATMWALTGLTTIFLLLRLYTRLIVLRAFGGDDHVFILAYICLLLMTTCYTKSATLGFGQSNAEIGNLDDISEATLWEAIGQTFTVIGTAIAKWSLGLFLVRLVGVRWLKIVVWVAMSGLLAGSISALFTFWLQVCRPFKYLWDRRIPGGYCPISAVPVAIVFNVFTVVVDLLFVALPWVFIWALRINKQEKIIILASMSLGVLPAASGVQRAILLGSLSSENYLRDTVSLIIWAAVELSVTLICICVPVCGPLFKVAIRRVAIRRVAIRRVARQISASAAEPSGNGGIKLSGIAPGASPQKQLITFGSGGRRPRLDDLYTTINKQSVNFSERYARGSPANNGSDEHVLLDNTWSHQQADHTVPRHPCYG